MTTPGLLRRALVLSEHALQPGHHDFEKNAPVRPIPVAADVATLVSNAVPRYTITSGKRRMSKQQMEPLLGLGIKITDEVKNKYKWDAFWDAPLDVPGTRAEGASMSNNPPPDLPRLASEVYRGSAEFHVNSMEKTNAS